MSKTIEKLAWEFATEHRLDPFSFGHVYADGYERAIKDALHKVKALIERYGAITPKNQVEDDFKTARLIGYRDIENYLEKILFDKNE